MKRGDVELVGHVVQEVVAVVDHVGLVDREHRTRNVLGVRREVAMREDGHESRNPSEVSASVTLGEFRGWGPLAP